MSAIPMLMPDVALQISDVDAANMATIMRRSESEFKAVTSFLQNPKERVCIFRSQKTFDLGVLKLQASLSKKIMAIETGSFSISLKKSKNKLELNYKGETLIIMIK